MRLQVFGSVTIDALLVYTDAQDAEALASAMNSPTAQAEMKQRISDASTDVAFKASIAGATVSSAVTEVIPTLMPSSSTETASNGGSTKDRNLSDGEIAGAIIGAIVGCICCMGIVFGLYRYRGKPPASSRMIDNDLGHGGREV